MHINIMVPYRLILLLTLLFLFIGCTPSRPTGDAVIVAATRSTETAVPPTPVPPTPTVTPTPTPTATASPTPTASATPTVSPTPTAALPDPATLAVMTADTVSSPDGRWQAISTQSEAIIINESAEQYVSLTVTDGTTTWTPVAEWRGFGLGHTWPAAFQWSQDGRYLYYTNLGGTAISEPGVYAQAGQIYRSADGGTPALNVVEVAVLTLIYDICLPTESSSIVRINLEEMTATTLIPKDDGRLQILDWPDPTQPEIQLIDKDGNRWWLDVQSGELTQEE